MDPLQTLQAALAVPANSREQADILNSLRDFLETHPGPIQVLVSTLINGVVNAGDSLLKRWVIELFHFAVGRADISIESKTQMASQALDTIALLIDDPNVAIVKTVVQCFTSIYPLLFRAMCSNRSNPAAWNTLTAAKARILDFVYSSTVPQGIRLAAMKFLQRVILVQTRGIPDPRLQNKNDPNISFCPPDHPFISVTRLEAEGQKLFEGALTFLYSGQNPDLLSAMINSWATLTKLRPSMLSVIVTAFKQWTPASLANLPASTIKSVEKTIRILLIHLSRLPTNAAFATQITEALQLQAARMEKAAIEEKQRKSGSLPDSKKRPPAEDAAGDAKRPKLEEGSSQNSSILSTFDFTALPSTLITDLIVANLEAFSEATLINLVHQFRQQRGLLNLSSPKSDASSPVVSTSTPPPPVVVVKEPVDPLKMDIDEDEMEYEPDRLNEELSGPLQPSEEEITIDPTAMADLSLIDFKLPPPRELASSQREALITDAVTRIWDGGEYMHINVLDPGAAAKEGSPQSRALDMWMLLLVRMVTRVAEPPEDNGSDEVKKEEAEEERAKKLEAFYETQDNLRKTLCDYIMSDFTARARLATIWMNEEWYNDQIRQDQDRNWRPNYDYWLGQIMASYQTLIDGKDRSFSPFLLDLPFVPQSVLGLLTDLAVEPDNADRRHVGFTTLRGLITQRPALRTEALTILLGLTTHPDKKVRTAAINTVKPWVPNVQPMDGLIRNFALSLLRKLQTNVVQPRKIPIPASDGGVPMANGDAAPTARPELEDGTEDENMEDGQLPQEEMIHTPYLPDVIELPAQKDHVLQHMELVFVLCTKVPQLLDEIFETYGQMDVTVQEAIQDLITALIRSLGSTNSKLLTLMRTCPPGAESLALRILTIFTESGRPSPQLVALVKGLISERDLDARFLIPIIAEMDKPDIIRHLPRIVSILNGQPDPKNLVRSVFSSVVTTPPQTFGSVTSNLPRVRQSELLTPAELMVLLHESEKEIGLKSAIEAIGICFSMTDVFRPEILAVVMQQIMDEPVLPVLFLRTVIQAVKTYTTLVPFVSTTLLSRLITKKIWTNPPLWEGFIRCAMTTAPQSFGALLQLPKEQLRELVDKQPSLKSGLREYVTKKAPNKARVAGFLDLFGDSDGSQPATDMAVDSN